jgi:transposase
LAIAEERVVIPWRRLAEGIMDDSAHDRSKRSLPERIDIRVGVERRRRWGREDKLRIVRESLAPNAIVTAVARRHEVSTSLLYTWRRQALAGLLQGFAPVQIAPDSGIGEPPTLDAPDKPVPEANPSEAVRGRGLIEVVWPNRIVVRVDADVDERALRSVLAALEAR